MEHPYQWPINVQETEAATAEIARMAAEQGVHSTQVEIVVLQRHIGAMCQRMYKPIIQARGQRPFMFSTENIGNSGLSVLDIFNPDERITIIMVRSEMQALLHEYGVKVTAII